MFLLDILYGGELMEIETLKKMANNKCNWRERLEAVKRLKNIDCQQSRDIITRLAIYDPVFKVKEAAFRVAQLFGIKKNGKEIYLGKKQKGNLVKGIGKKLCKVRDSLSEEFAVDEFKEKFKQMYPGAYDIYDGDKGDKLNSWLERVIPSLPKKKQ